MAGPAESSTARHSRITKEASAYLTNYASNVNSYPKKAEKLAILEVVRAIPGNENFTIEKLAQWFNRHRNPAHARSVTLSRPTAHATATVLLDDETILFPKLTPTHLQQLRVLYRKRPNPTEGIITFWAERLNADRMEVAAWIQYQQEKAKENEYMSTTPESPDIPLRQIATDRLASTSASPTIPDFPRPHLPTPAKSLSPVTSPHTRMMSLPSIAVKEEGAVSPVMTFGKPPLPQQRQVAYTEHRSVLEGLSPLAKLVQDSSSSREQLPVEAQTPTSTLLSGEHSPRRFSRMKTTASLATSIRESLRTNNHVEEPPPTTADEFVIRFQKVEDQINTFMKAFDDGKLAVLGWDSSLNKATLSKI